MARESARGTLNVTLTGPVTQARSQSARGTLNVSLTPPAVVQYGQSRPGKLNVTLVAPTPPPVYVFTGGLFKKVVPHVRTGGAWKPAS